MSHHDDAAQASPCHAPHPVAPDVVGCRVVSVGSRVQQRPEQDRSPRWPLAVDATCDALVVAFACWTVFYQVGLAAQFSMLWAGWPWLVLAALLVTGAVVRVVVGRPEPDVHHGVEETGAPGFGLAGATGTTARRLLVGGVALLLLSLAGRGLWSVWPIAVAGIALVAIQLRLAHGLAGPGTSSTGDRPAPPGGRSQLVALTMSIGFGVLGMFLLRPDADDVYYVNRATWVETHGTAARHDTMFSPDLLPPATGGGLPLSSVEAWQGVLAHALGIQAATFCYLVLVPVLGTLAGWTTWRLVRAWAPRRRLLVLAVSMLFVVSSALMITGNYSLGRIWQGKATAYAILLPLIWLWLSRRLSGPRVGDLVLLAAGGVAFVGLTTTSALMAPVVAGSAIVAAVVLRSSALATGATAFVAGPVLAGLMQALGSAEIGGGGDPAPLDVSGSFDRLFGMNLPVAMVTVLAVVLVTSTVPGRSGILLGCGALATLVCFLPGVFELVDLATGAGAIAWRLTISLPVWVLVGLLVAAPLSWAEAKAGATKVVAATVSVIVLAVPLTCGDWLWSVPGASLTPRPGWKVDPTALSDVRAVQKLGSPPGRWLLPPKQMEVLAISTVGHFAVVPRTFYLPNLRVPAEDLAARKTLLRLVTAQPTTPASVRDALDLLDVTVACVPGDDPEGRRILTAASGGTVRAVGTMRCHVGAVAE